MQQLLQQSTAATVRFGPLVQLADGGTVMPSLTIQKANVKISKAGGALASAHSDQGASDAGAPYDSLGVYALALDATDTNTLGRLSIFVTPAGTRPMRMDFSVVTAAVYAQLITGTAKIGADADADAFDASQGKVWFVRTTGSDSNDGLTVATALLTINAAAVKAKRGDTINSDVASANATGIDYSQLDARVVTV